MAKGESIPETCIVLIPLEDASGAKTKYTSTLNVAASVKDCKCKNLCIVVQDPSHGYICHFMNNTFLILFSVSH